jgi:hypothetical protein
MSKAENFTVRMGEDLKERMKAHQEINWSHVIRENVRSMLDDLERTNALAEGSQLTEDDVEELANQISKAASERARDDAAEQETDRQQLDRDKESRVSVGARDATGTNADRVIADDSENDEEE